MRVKRGPAHPIVLVAPDQQVTHGAVGTPGGQLGGASPDGIEQSVTESETALLGMDVMIGQAFARRVRP